MPASPSDARWQEIPAGSESKLWNLVFFCFPYFSWLSNSTWTSRHTHTPAHRTRMLLLPAADVLSHPADTRQSTGVKFISEAIALRASHLISRALVPTAGQDLPPVMGSSSSQKRLDFFPHTAPWLLVKWIVLRQVNWCVCCLSGTFLTAPTRLSRAQGMTNNAFFLHWHC